MKTDIKVITIPDFMVFLKQFSQQESFTATELLYKTAITYSHILRIRDAVKSLGLVTTVKEGRSIIITITEKGKQIVKTTEEFLILLGINEDNLHEFRNKTKLKNKIVVEEQVVEEPVVEEPVVEQPQVESEEYVPKEEEYVKEEEVEEEVEEDETHIDGTIEEVQEPEEVVEFKEEEVKDDNSNERI